MPAYLPRLEKYKETILNYSYVLLSLRPAVHILMHRKFNVRLYDSSSLTAWIIKNNERFSGDRSRRSLDCVFASLSTIFLFGERFNLAGQIE